MDDDEWRKINRRCSHGWLRSEQCEICNAPKREWVGLTEEDKKKIATVAGCTEDDDGHIVTEIFRLAEIKLKEKNDH